MKKNIRLITCIATLLFSNLTLCTPEQWVTVIVHGTIMPHISLQNLIKIMHDNINRSTYKLTTEFIRNDPFFYVTQPIQELGLHKVHPSDPQGPTTAHIFTQSYDMLDSLNCPCQRNTRYYTYGWSGLVSKSHRLKEAHTFYDKLTEELTRLRKKNINPKVRIVTYSHGGNLALNLAAVQKKRTPKHPLTVSELIVIGMPVQKATDHLAASPMFERIFHLYSLNDSIQRLDFANRRFLDRETFTVPKKLTQVKLNLNGAKAKRGKYYRKSRMDPGHIELWFFGWTPRMYRKNFPFYPLPFAVFLQWIINSIRQIDHAPNSLSVEIDLNKKQVTIKSYKLPRPRMKKVIPFVPLTKLEKLKELAMQIKPDRQEYSRELHAKRKKWARLQATYHRRRSLNQKKGNKKKRQRT